jgi:hypothetical protein
LDINENAPLEIDIKLFALPDRLIVKPLIAKSITVRNFFGGASEPIRDVRLAVSYRLTGLAPRFDIFYWQCECLRGLSAQFRLIELQIINVRNGSKFTRIDFTRAGDRLFYRETIQCIWGKTGGLALCWWPRAESNRRHKDFQSSALPTELPGHFFA